MEGYVRVAQAAEIQPGMREVFEIDHNLWVAVFNVGGKFHAIEDVCTHDDGPLAEGELEGHVIECPRHGAQFDVRTGKVLRLPAVTPVPTFDVRVEDGEIYVSLEETTSETPEN